MATDKHFKLSKSTKRLMASLKGSSQDRSSFKELMISAQVREESFQKSRLKSREKSNSSE